MKERSFSRTKILAKVYNQSQVVCTLRKAAVRAFTYFCSNTHHRIEFLRNLSRENFNFEILIVSDCIDWLDRMPERCLYACCSYWWVSLNASILKGCWIYLNVYANNWYNLYFEIQNRGNLLCFRKQPLKISVA